MRYEMQNFIKMTKRKPSNVGQSKRNRSMSGNVLVKLHVKLN